MKLIKLAEVSVEGGSAGLHELPNAAFHTFPLTFIHSHELLPAFTSCNYFDVPHVLQYTLLKLEAYVEAKTSVHGLVELPVRKLPHISTSFQRLPSTCASVFTPPPTHMKCLHGFPSKPQYFYGLLYTSSSQVPEVN